MDGNETFSDLKIVRRNGYNAVYKPLHCMMMVWFMCIS
jgi:hypothetical protein